MSLNFITTVNADEIYLYNIPENSLLTVDRNHKIIASVNGTAGTGTGTDTGTGTISGEANKLSVEVYNELYRIFISKTEALQTFLKKTDIDLSKYLLIQDASNIYALKNDNVSLINSTINDLKNWTSTAYYSKNDQTLFNVTLNNNFVTKVLLNHQVMKPTKN